LVTVLTLVTHCFHSHRAASQVCTESCILAFLHHGRQTIIFSSLGWNEKFPGFIFELKRFFFPLFFVKVVIYVAFVLFLLLTYRFFRTLLPPPPVVASGPLSSFVTCPLVSSQNAALSSLNRVSPGSSRPLSSHFFGFGSSLIFLRIPFFCYARVSFGYFCGTALVWAHRRPVIPPSCVYQLRVQLWQVCFKSPL